MDRVKGYCPSCGRKEEHVLSKELKFYFCLACGAREEKERLEDIWHTFIISR